MTEIQTDEFRGIIESGAIPSIVQLAAVNNHKIQLPAVKVLGTLVTHLQGPAQLVVENNGVEALAMAVESRFANIRKGAISAVSSLCAGSEYIGVLISRGVVARLVQLVLFQEPPIQKEALWALTNILMNGSFEQIDFLVTQNVITILHYFLGSEDSKLLSVALLGVKHLLQAGATIDLDDNPYLGIMEKVGLIDYIEKLQTHDNGDIYNEALFILETYCELEVESNYRELIQTIQQTFDI